jgi:carbon monoxide dehydrogenase subunit G
MKLEHSFEVGLPPHETFELLLDVPRIAHCMPGASLDSVDGDTFTGKVRVKLGPIAISYAGVANILERDPDQLRAVIDARGKEARGAGEAKATIEAVLHPTEIGTRVDVITDLAVTGKPAQFGRGLMVDVGRKLIGQFANALAADIEAAKNGPVTAAAPAQGTDQTRVPSPSVDRPPLPSTDLPAAPAPAAAQEEINVFALISDRVPVKALLVLAGLVVGFVIGRATSRAARN